MTADTEFTLAAGDYAVFLLLASGEARNDSQEAASVVVAATVPSDVATPTAATPAS